MSSGSLKTSGGAAGGYRVVLAANRSLPLHPIANHLVRTLAELPMESTILLRKPKTRPPAAFEAVASEVCRDLSIPVEWHTPTERGREGTFRRDVEMVRSAHLVIGYFDGDSPMEGGTGHVLERAMADEIPCKAWVWDRPEEALDWLGGD